MTKPLLKRVNYAAHNAAGIIVGLYNNEDHRESQIPKPYIAITPQQHTEIVRRPNDFSVDVNSGKLLDNKRNKGVSLDHKETDVPEVVRKIAAGFMYNGVCYWADDRASDNITQCLAISSLDKDFKAVLKVTVDGEIDYIPVKQADLIKIAKGVNALRIGL